MLWFCYEYEYVAIVFYIYPRCFLFSFRVCVRVCRFDMYIMDCVSNRGVVFFCRRQCRW